MEYEIAGFDNAEGTLFRSNLKSKRYDKTTFGISGTVEVVEDFSNDWEVYFEVIIVIKPFFNQKKNFRQS